MLTLLLGRYPENNGALEPPGGGGGLHARPADNPRGAGEPRPLAVRVTDHYVDHVIRKMAR